MLRLLKSMRSHAAQGSPFLGLASALRARRKSLKLTQRQLSELAGCGLDFIYDVEAGKPTLRLNKLVDVLLVVGLELVLSEGKTGIRIGSKARAR